MPDFDIIIIGAGPGGYVTAERAGAAGKKVCLIEREEHLGGVCLNWGCVPTKTLLASSKAYYSATHGEAFGVTAEGVKFHLDKAMARKKQVQDGLRTGIRGLMKKFKVEVLRGSATLTAKDTVQIGDRTITASNIIIATVEEGLKSGVITNRHEQFKGKSLKTFLHDKEKEFLQRTIESVNGDKEKAANELGISLATLYRKLPSDLKK